MRLSVTKRMVDKAGKSAGIGVLFAIILYDANSNEIARYSLRAGGDPVFVGALPGGGSYFLAEETEDWYETLNFAGATIGVVPGARLELDPGTAVVEADGVIRILINNLLTGEIPPDRYPHGELPASPGTGDGGVPAYLYGLAAISVAGMAGTLLIRRRLYRSAAAPAAPRRPRLLLRWLRQARRQP